MKRNLTLLLLSFLIHSSALFGFTLTVTPTPETCTGNGSLLFNVTNPDPNGSITYLVYKLPDLTVPIATVTTNSLTGLSAGDYHIVANETVGTVTTSQQQDVTITSNLTPLSFTIQSLNQACSTTSNIVVNVTSGTAATYEIITGPITFPPQASNTFSGLPVGVYKIRVFDACGVGVVSTFTVTLNPTGLTIGDPVLSDTSPPSCNFTVVTNTITPASGTVIGYPLSIHYEIHPPGGGAPIVMNSTMNTGNPTSQNLVTTIPEYLNQGYDYEITIVDACGTTVTHNFPINHSILFSNTVTILDCNQNYFTLSATNFTPPYTLNFTTMPAGFNPSAYSSSYPGPYNSNTIDFGSDTFVTPLGNYSVTITDNCGRTATTSFEIINVPNLPSALGVNDGCLTNTGGIVAAINGSNIVTATIINAPPSYPNPLPSDVSSFIDSEGNLVIHSLPLGDYTLTFTDTCNDVLAPLDVTVPAYVDQGVTAMQRPGCELQKGSVRIKGENGKLTSVIITAAPAAFGQTLPFNVSNNIIITDGNFYLNNLPPGNYTFATIDECNFTGSTNVAVNGYTITSSAFSLQENCGSFDIPLNFVSNATIGQSFWLQKLIDATNNVWGHPDTGTLYVEGTVPTPSNSYALANMTTNYNLTFNGTFRIVRDFESYNNGADFNSGMVTSTNKNCIEILSPTLFFNQVLGITDAHRMPCSPNGQLDVVIEATGTNPLHYTIIEKDSAPFSFDNGNSNIFYNLTPGVYVFQVEDICGNVVTRIFDVSALLSLVNITQPNNLLDCQETITGNETFDLTQQSATVLATQSVAQYTISYYTSLVQAEAGVGAITNLTNYNPTTNPQTIYVRLIYNPLPNCYQTTSFDLIVGQVPKLNLQETYLNCETTPIEIDASTGNLPTTTYNWSNGVTDAVVSVSQPGTTNLTVTATNSYGNGLNCTNTKDISVTVSQLPVIDHVGIQDWTEHENSITIFTSNNTAFEYSLDGFNFQSSNTFTNLPSGLYTVYVRDNEGCGMVETEVALLDYPRYFTPNGDGYHETWRIQNSELEPAFKVNVFDRFGKLIKSFNSDNEGWDGTYNGQQLFSTDYWFVVYRQDGRIHKGHFSLKR